MTEHYTPRPYQSIATDFIMDTHRCLLAAKPGMGKTASMLAALDILKLAGSQFFPVLVLAPKRVANTVWPDELHKWDAFRDLSMTIIHGEHKLREAEIRAPKTDIYVTQYANIEWLCDKLPQSRWPFKTVVADESTRLKGFRLSKSAVRARRMAEIAKYTGRWINMTGTPAANGLTDLWGQMWFVDFGQRLGRTYTTFMQRWFYENQYTHEVKMLPGADKEIYTAIADVTLALRPEDWFELQKPVYSTLCVELPAAARSVYKQMETKLFIELDAKPIEAVNASVKTLKLLELASGSVYDSASEWHDVHDAKLEALENIVEELNEPLLLAYYFQFTPDRVRRLFKHAKVLDTEADFAAWNRGEIPLGMIHYQSAGHGLNLQHGGRALVYFDEIWDGELREQVLERLGPTRQAQAGLNRSVLVWDITAKSTMDEQAMAKTTGKLTLQEALMQARARTQ